jgi:hypothetical protein
LQGVRSQPAFISDIFMRNTLFTLFFLSSALYSEINYTRDIKPILSDRCYNCHGPDGGKHGEKWRGGLRLDIKDMAMADMSKTKFETKQRKFKAEGKDVKGGPSSPRYAIIPGDVKNSMLIDRIFTDDPDDIMPPLDSHITLSDREKNLIKVWIEAGAPWEQHWAFEAPKKPDLPKVKNSSWAKNDLDLFVLSKLEQESIQPAPIAEPLTLLRRMALSLTGLPATQDHVDKVKSKGHAALEPIIDELLSSKAFAERMAVEWFDNARYADTLDYQYDRNRDAWPWKEWVIKSFRENKPFDDFIREQLAGDLLPNPTQDQILATSFNRLHGISTEGGIIQEEYRVNYVNDRTNTFGTTFLGLTYDCARCHNHKFDPLTQEDFYTTAAFFSNIKEYSKDTKSYSSRSSTLKYSLTDSKVLQHFDSQLKKSIENLNELEKLDEIKVQQWQNNVAKSTYGELAFEQDQTFDPAQLSITQEIKTPLKHIQSLEFIIKSDLKDAPKVSAQIDHISLQKTDKNGKVSNINLRHVYEAKAVRRSSINNVYKLDQKTWNLDLKKTPFQNTIFKCFTTTDQKLELKITFKKGSTKGIKWQVKFYSESDDLIVARAKNIKGFFNRLSKPTYVNYYKAHYPQASQTKQYIRSQASYDNEKNRHVTVLVMDERPKSELQKSYILTMGEYDKREKQVGMATPTFLPALKDQPLNRLGLANWLFTEEQPLFARVTVNRIWQMLFGMGIVKTANDFGAQGDQPSHPKLLDHLAVKFRTSGWNLNALIKDIVTSSTFQQSSFERSELSDPENKKLARGPRFRIHAEFVRDQALAVSGLLKHHPKGKAPVYPYQPEGLWKDLTNRPGSQMVYKESKGEDLYRRSVYTYWKRAQPNPSFVAFDAPKRGVCTVTRSKTNTPLQALVTWHDPTYIEAARAYAEKAYAKRDNGKIFNTMYLETFNRPIRDQEEQALSKYFDQLFEKYQSQPEKVKSILSVGALDQSKVENPAWVAAFSSVCLALFNTSEFVTLQ